ncbi:MULTISPECIES: hypothetical protein [unclassified Myroides]|uniref:hypothetical protein n=1 Tax=unclassified Myroides TaxID=2642485 RepID=UPI003D2F7F68
MKRGLLLGVILFCSGLLAQEGRNSTQDSLGNTKNNMIKMNVIPLAWGSGSLSYERKVVGRLVGGITVNYRPESGAPFKRTLQKVFENDVEEGNTTFDIDQLRYSNFSVAPEVKLYLGKKGAFRGFYVAVFGKVESTKVDYAYRFEGFTFLNQELELPLRGNVKARSGGLYFGVQWHLGKRFYLDWQIIGANYGTADIDISAYRNLTLQEQAELQNFAEDLTESFDKLTFEVNDNGIKMKGKMPWLGLRTGLSIGYRF